MRRPGRPVSWSPVGVAAALVLIASACTPSFPNRSPCQSTRDCPGGQQCRQGRCEIYPRLVGGTCSSEGDCLSAFCFEGTCRDRCTDGFCPADEYCEQVACLPRGSAGQACERDEMCLTPLTCADQYCRARCTGADDGPCASGQFCNLDLCTRASASGSACTRNRGCSSGLCVENICRDSCPSGLDDACQPTEFCELSICAPRLPAGRGCLRASQCLSGICLGQVCRANECAGQGDPACPLGEFCNGTRCESARPPGTDCDRDRTCSSGYCVAGRCRTACAGADDLACARTEYCDDQKCVPTLGSGSPCARAGQCQSGFCVVEICRSPCAGADDAPCPQTEYCAGSFCTPGEATGAFCSRDRACASQHCIDLRCRAACAGGDDAPCAPTEYCDGTTCAPRAAPGAACSRDRGCASGQCFDDRCRVACTGTDDGLCPRGEYCDGTRCVAAFAAGAPCTRTAMCTSDICVLGLCRSGCTGNDDSLCGTGEFCNGNSCAPVLPGGSLCTRSAQCQSQSCSDGICRNVCVGTDDAACATGEYCDGDSCRKKRQVNNPCLRDAVCFSGLCRDGRCRTPCQGDNDTACPPEEFCDGLSCVGARPQASECSRDRQCSSGFCTDGVCCEGRCGACLRCNLSGDGKCSAASAQTTDSRCPVTATETCGLSGRCDGAGLCAYYDSSTVCRAAVCVGFQHTPANHCDGAGRCVAESTVSCYPNACGDAACRDDCSQDSDCAPGLTCTSNACRPARIVTVAGGGAGDGAPALAASLKRPVAVLWSAGGGNPALLIADEAAHRVRSVDLTTGAIETVAGTGIPGFSAEGTPATKAPLDGPAGLALGASGELYISDSGNHRVRAVDLGMAGTIKTIAGNGSPGSGGNGGPAIQASLWSPTKLYFEPAGGLYITDTGNHRVQLVASSASIFTVAGTGVAGYAGDGDDALLARFNGPTGLAFISANEWVVADRDNHRVRRYKGDKTLVTEAGDGTPGFNGDGTATSAWLQFPSGLASPRDGTWIVADTFNHRVRLFSDLNLTTIVGTGATGFAGDGQLAVDAELNEPRDVALDPAGNLFVADTGNRRIRKVDAASSTIATIAGSGFATYAGDGLAPTEAAFGEVGGIALSDDGDLYVAQRDVHVVRRVKSGITATIAGNASLGPGCSGDGGLATAAQLSSPSAVALYNGDVFIADSRCHAVRKVSGTTITTAVGRLGDPGNTGDGGPATNARLNRPMALAFDTVGNLYIADAGNNRVRRLLPNGDIEAFAGSGNVGFGGDGGPAVAAKLAGPGALAASAAGDVYLSDIGNRRVRRVDPQTGFIRTVAGNGFDNYNGDGNLAVQTSIGVIGGLAVDPGGNLYLSASANRRILVLSPDARLYPVAGTGERGVPDEGSAAQDAPLWEPRGMAWSKSEGRLYFIDGPEGAAEPESRVRRLE